MPSLMLGVDIGTTATKAVLVDSGGGLVAEASLPVALHSDHPGWAEAEPAEWWSNLCALVPILLEKSHASRSDVAVVATTGMVPAVLLLDHSGNPLGRAALQNDARAVAEIDVLTARLADTDLVARTGSPLSQQSVAPTLMWAQAHSPERWEQTCWVVGSYDWLAMALGAAPHVDRNWALESGLYELSGLTDADHLTGELVPEVLEAAGIAPHRLARVRAAGQVTGEVSEAAAGETGLAPGTPIALGGADHVLSGFAAGLRVPGDWLVKLGGAGDILVVSDHVFVDRRLYLDAHPQNGLWLPNGCMATSGSLLVWLQGVLDEDRAVLELEAAAERARAGRLPAIFPGRKVAEPRSPASWRVRRPTPRPRARRPLPVGSRGGRLRLPPSRRGLCRARSNPWPGACEQRRQPVPAMEADTGRCAGSAPSSLCSITPGRHSEQLSRAASRPVSCRAGATAR